MSSVLKKKKGPGQKAEAQAVFGFGLLGSAYLLESHFPFLGGPDPGLCINCFTARCNMRKTRFSKRCTVSLLGSQTSGAVGTAAVFSVLGGWPPSLYSPPFPGTSQARPQGTFAQKPCRLLPLCPLSSEISVFLAGPPPSSPLMGRGAGQQVTYPYLP